MDINKYSVLNNVNERVFSTDFVVNDKSRRNIEKFVDDLCDPSKESVAPLTKVDTFILRRANGINCKRDTVHEIANLYKVPFTTIETRLFLIDNFVRNMVVRDRLKEGLSTVLLKEELKDKLVGDLDYNSLLHYTLAKDNIYTLEELLSKSLSFYKKNNYAPFLKEMKKGVHDLGLYFVDELDEYSKDYIINNEDDENKKLNSDISWLNLSTDSYNFIKKKARQHRFNINTIGDVRELMEKRRIMHFDIVNKLYKNNISVKKAFDGEEYLDIGISILNIPMNILKRLHSCGIDTIEDLIKCSKDDIYKLVNNNKKQYNSIINAVYEWGVCFIDDDNYILSNDINVKKKSKN